MYLLSSILRYTAATNINNKFVDCKYIPAVGRGNGKWQKNIKKEHGQKPNT